MNFLNPVVLFGLAAAILPLVIHLLSKRRAKEVAFPSIRLLERMQTDRIRMLNIKQLILLLLRTLIIILIVLAFARPALRSFFRENARTSAVIIIDSSASMLYVDNGEILFDRALRKAEEIISFLKEDDTSAILVSGQIPHILAPGLTKDKEKLIRALHDIENEWSESSPTRSFEMAGDLLSASTALNKEIYYCTDSAVNTLPDDFEPADENIRLYTLLLGPVDRDGSVIGNLSLIDKLVAPGKKLTFRVSGNAGVYEDEMEIEFFVDGERKGRSRSIKRLGNTATADFTYTPEDQGLYSVYAVVNDGYFEPGERRGMILNVPRNVNVYIAGGKPEDIYFLERALGSDAEESVFSVTTALEGEIDQSNIRSADVIVLSGIADLPNAVYQTMLTAVVERGAGIIVFPPVDVGSSLYADGIFRDIFPAAVETRIHVEGQDQGNYEIIDSFDFSHPILRDISTDGDFQRPVVRSYLKMTPSSKAAVLARFSDNTPAAGEIACGRGRAVVFAVNAFSDDSDLPLTGIFVPFFIRSVQYLSGTLSGGGIYETGAPVRESLGDLPQDAEVTIKPENMPVKRVAVEKVGSRTMIKNEHAGKPGFYSVYAGVTELGRFCVTTPRSEILFARAGNAMIAEAYKNIRWKIIADSQNLTELVTDDRYGKELFGMFLVLALILLGVEMAISRKV